MSYVHKTKQDSSDEATLETSSEALVEPSHEPLSELAPEYPDIASGPSSEPIPLQSPQPDSSTKTKSSDKREKKGKSKSSVKKVSSTKKGKGKSTKKRRKVETDTENCCSLCFQPENEDIKWIQCDTCDGWFCEVCADIVDWEHYEEEGVQYLCLLCKL